MISHKHAIVSKPAKSPTLRERAAQARDAAGRFLKRAAGQVTDQPQPASLPEASAADRHDGAFPTAAQHPHNAGRGHSADFDRATADHGRAPHQEHDMGRHETFENAAPIADELLTGTMLGRAATFVEQVAQAGTSHDVLAGAGIDHRDGTVSYCDATGRVSRRPLASWINFNAQQMHSRVQGEIGRRRVIEANHLPGEEHVAWEAKIRRELRADAIFALSFQPERAFKAEQDRRSGAEPTTADDRAETDAMLLALAPEWEAARDAYAAAIQRQITVSDDAANIEPPPSRDRPHDEWRRLVEDWRERTGIEAVEAASAETLDVLCAIEDRIAELPAASLAGLRLKARVAQRNEDIDVDWPDKLGEGLTRDLLAFGADGLADANPAGDALLVQLGRQFEAARKRETAACEACNAAEDEADRHMPERPAALLFRASDHHLRLGKYLTHPDHLEGTEVTADDVAWMKRKPYVREVRRPVRPEDGLPDDAHTVVESHPWPEAQERADEIVTAWDAWHAERLRVHSEYVTEALDDAANEAGIIAADLAMRIADLPAHTAAGFRVKLRALACYNPSFFYGRLPELPDPDQALSYSLKRDMQIERPPAVEPEKLRNPSFGPVEALAAEPSPVFVAIADSTRAAAADALSDASVSPDLRAAVEAHRDATLAMLLETDESNEATDARSAAVDQTGVALRAVPARSLADVRCKLALLLPEILPDVNGSTPVAFLQNIREDVDQLAQRSAASSPSLVSLLDLANATMGELQTIRDVADHVGSTAYAHAWRTRCHKSGPALWAAPHNDAGKLMQWLGDALTDVETAVDKEAARRVPDNSTDRETRLSMRAVQIIDNGDPDEIAAFAGELLAHASAELAGR